MAKRSIAVAAVFGFLSASYCGFTGDEAAYSVSQRQPMKLAAMEGLYEGETNAGAVVFGIINSEKRPGDEQKDFIIAVKAPIVLSLLANREFGSFVPGVNDLVFGNEEQGITSVKTKMERGRKAIEYLAAFKEAQDNKHEAAAQEALSQFNTYKDDMGYGHLTSPSDAAPPVATTFYAFHIMVVLGTLFPLVFLVALYFLYKGNLEKQRLFQLVGVLCIPLGYIAQQAGWVVAEVGRQPWAIQGLLPVHVANTNLTTGTVQTTFFIFLGLFTMLLIAELRIMFKQIQLGPEEN